MLHSGVPWPSCVHPLLEPPSLLWSLALSNDTLLAIFHCFVQCCKWNNQLYSLLLLHCRWQPKHKIRLAGTTICWVKLLLPCFHYSNSLDYIGSQSCQLTWVSSVVTHLIHIYHSLWVFCNQVVHYWSLLGWMQVAEAGLAATIQMQFILVYQDCLPSEQHYVNNHSVASLLCTPLPNH